MAGSVYSKIVVESILDAMCELRDVSRGELLSGMHGRDHDLSRIRRAMCLFLTRDMGLSSSWVAENVPGLASQSSHVRRMKLRALRDEQHDPIVRCALDIMATVSESVRRQVMAEVPAREIA